MNTDRLMEKRDFIGSLNRFYGENMQIRFSCRTLKLPPVTLHERKSSWPSRNGPAIDVTSLPCASKIRGSSGDSVISEREID